MASLLQFVLIKDEKRGVNAVGSNDGKIITEVKIDEKEAEPAQPPKEIEPSKFIRIRKSMEGDILSLQTNTVRYKNKDGFTIDGWRR